VLQFTDSDAFAGTERHMLDLATALRERGVRAEIACPARGPLAERARAAGVTVLEVEKGSGIDFPAVRKLRDALKAGRFDLVHSHNGRTALIAALATTAGGRGKTVTTQHFPATESPRRRGVGGLLSRAVHQWVLKKAARVVAISGPVR
jgi:phosphatidylinositol alpha-mannosyltransferase